ncbi:MAG: threonine/serine exporter family protein [Lachnospiraceae bacterium]|nr:threonine/serine exporter family protein [Lachnospiraceae bacterium]
MDYDALLDLATELGYQLAICGAETFRIEESIMRILDAYRVEIAEATKTAGTMKAAETMEKAEAAKKADTQKADTQKADIKKDPAACSRFESLKAQAFAIPNCLIVSIRTPKGESLTRMRRIGYHGNDLDGVEHFSNLSRRICREKPDIETFRLWLDETKDSHRAYPLPMMLLGSFLAAGGFCILFDGSLKDAVCAGICGLIIACVSHFLDRFQTNPFFVTILSAFTMAVPAYAMGAWGLADNSDAVVIGALMLLVPGLLFTNAMRDIIFGDINSGVNRVVQVFLTAVAIALGTGAAWNLSSRLLWTSLPGGDPGYSYLIHALACFIGCAGFSILFNIHGIGTAICCLGGMLSWTVYFFAMRLGASELTAYFLATVFAAAYSELMARVRKFPAISYLVVSIFPLIPGAGVYYTMNYLVSGETSLGADQGLCTIAVAGLMAVAILLVSTIVRLWSVARRKG